MTTVELIEQAVEARQNAYAPYSGYTVGCAIESMEGRVFTGCNIENVSYGATLCAERVALGNMVSAGDQQLKQVVVATRDGSAPCGICLQVLKEFSIAETEIIAVADNGTICNYALSELMPRAFASPAVKRTERA